jgi:uncharacterized protein (TIGR01244 family)
MTVARYLTETFAVAPQIAIEDLADLKAQGFKTIVCNRPDGEVPEELSAANMERACRELGLEFVTNPLSHGSLSPDHIEIQRRAATSDSPVLAYCASGNRSSILWGLAMAGTHTSEDILNRTTAAGYNLQALVPQLDAIAARSAG